MCKTIIHQSTYLLRTVFVILLLLSWPVEVTSHAEVVDFNVPRPLTPQELELLSPYIQVAASQAIDDDTHTLQLPFTPTFTDLVEYLRYTYWDMPRECRRDLCDAENTTDFDKGTFQWPETLVGTRRLLRCPYAVHDFIYAHRDCLPINRSNTDWSDPVYEHCPPPPFSVVLNKEYKKYQLQLSEDNSKDSEVLCSDLSQTILTLSALLIKYPQHPQLHEDAYKLTHLFQYWIHSCLTNVSAGQLTELELRAVLTFSDQLSSTGKWSMLPQDSVARYFPELVTTLFSCSHTLNYVYEGLSISVAAYPLNFTTTANVTLYVLDLDPSEDNVENEEVYIRSENTLAIISLSTDMQVNAQAILFTQADGPLRRIAELNYNISSLSDSSPSRTKRRSVADHIPTVRDPTLLLLSDVEILAGGQSNALNLDDREGLFEMITNQTEPELLNNDLSEVDSFFSKATSVGVLKLAPEVDVKNRTFSSAVTLNRSARNAGLIVLSGPMLYLRLSHESNGDNRMEDSLKVVNIEVIFRSPSFKVVHDGVFCAQLSRESFDQRKDLWTDVKYWTTEGCAMIEAQLDSVKCHCNVTTGEAGHFITVFASIMFPIINGKGPRRFSPPNYFPEITSFSTFLGFPYNRELFITSQVLRPISLVCLILTVAFHLAFRKSRKGATARILLNLCVSLIALQLTLYLAEGVASTRLGCRASNILRYYVIMASLLWNGAEAHNMYRMLVKVFSGETSWFVMQAGAVAWGLPALVIGLALIIRLNVFDGSYLDCKFRCSLDRTMMIYAYLIPMLLIVLHNVIMFTLVLAALRRNVLGQSKAVKRSNSIRLTGAVTMLVLLGVPWVFSSFAVIDAGENTQLKNLEAIFNIIFIVFINLQGIFIFCFHCARNKTIRTEMSSVMSRSSMSYVRSSSSTRQTNSTHSEHNVKGEGSTAKEKTSSSKV